MSPRLLTPLLLTLLLACAGNSPDAEPAAADAGPQPADAAATADGGAGPDATAPAPDTRPPGPDTGDPWAEVDRLAREAVTTNEIPGLGIAIYDRDDRLVFRTMYGDFAPDRKVAVASASKMVSGLVLLELVARGTLDLDATTGAVLGWSGANAAITLRQLMSFTSGLPPDIACAYQPMTTLAACVDELRDSQAVAAPGTRFDYGGTHLHVAARMAEVKTGKTWNQLFREILADPLSLTEEVRYYTAPRRKLGNANPLVAGGMRASMDDYAHFLAIAFHEGDYRNLDIANTALFAAQARQPFPDVTIGVDPVANAGEMFRYGLCAWLECDTPAAGCQALSSPGAFGFTPWLDREVGYYAMIGTELGQLEGGVAPFSVRLAQSLKPAITAALGR